MENIKSSTRTDLFGREKIYATLGEDELTADNIGMVLQDALEKHKKNISQIEYLRRQIRGDQEILKKVKSVRSNINNKVVENHLTHVVSFNKGYVFGDPVQYVQVVDETDSVLKDSQGSENSVTLELNKLNTYMRNNNKASKDLELADDILVAGVCPRIVMYSDGEEGLPFEFYNLRPEQAFVVYSNGIKEEPLFSVYMLIKKDYLKNKETLHLDVRTKKNKFKYTMPYENFTQGIIGVPTYLNFKDAREKVKQETNVLGEIPIVEYEFNKYRISLVEYILSAQNTLNTITSADIDDIEQFVQAFMVLINAEIDSETYAQVKAEGAMSIKSSQDLDADVKMLTAKMSHSETKVLYDRIYNTMLVNAGVPLINTSSGGGDTGIARLADNGWLMADTKAREKELAFIKSEQPFLKIVLKMLRRSNEIKDLELGNITTKFTRNKSDNILTKVQALQQMQGVVHPEIAFATSGLFNDPGEAETRSNEYFGKDFFKLAKKTEVINDKKKLDVDDKQESDSNLKVEEVKE